MSKRPESVHQAHRESEKRLFQINDRPNGRPADYLIFYFQGEPYINPDFLDMVDYASSKGLYTITSTNAHFLTDENARRTIESGLDRLIISIDGTTQDVYGNYRVQGDLDKVIDGAKRVVYWRDKLKSKTPHLIFQFLVVRQNEHQIPEIYTLARSIGIDEVKLKSIQVYDYENGHPLLPENQTYSRYHKGKDGKYALKHKLINHCWKLWHANVITWDGKIVPCCFDKDAKYKLGDLEQDTFIDIWKGGAYNNFRKNIMAGRNKIDICQNCTEGCKVWL